MEDRDPEYVKSNLGLPTFTQNGLNLIGLLHRSGQALWLQGYDQDTKSAVNLADIAGRPLLVLEASVSHRLSQELNPAIFYGNDLAEAIAWLAEHMEANQGLTVHVEASGEGPLESESLTIFLFRATSELLSNEAHAKHSLMVHVAAD